MSHPVSSHGDLTEAVMEALVLNGVLVGVCLATLRHTITTPLMRGSSPLNANLSSKFCIIGNQSQVTFW